MKKEINIWNILHDGEITVIEKNMDGLYIIFVNIPYLRKRISPLGDSIVLILSNVKKLLFKDLEGIESVLVDELESTNLHILYTESISMPILVETTAGTLILDYDKIDLKLDTGQSLEYEKVELICREYWNKHN